MVAPRLRMWREPPRSSAGNNRQAHSPRPNGTFDALNAARGVAALCVMLFHAPLSANGSFAPSGYLAVDFFFMLSGFIIAHAYDRRLDAGMGLWRFVRLRIARFYPAYAVGLAVAGLVAAGVAVKQPHLLGAIAASLALTAMFLPSPATSYSGGLLFPANGPAWSLSVELVVNIVYAALLRRFGVVAVALWAAVGLAGILLPALGGHELGGPYWSGWWMGYCRAFFAFPVGILIHRYRPRLPAFFTLPALILLATLLVCRPVWTTPLYDAAVIVVAFPSILIALTASIPASWQPVCQYLGRTSYPLYAIHVPVFMACSGFSKALAFDLGAAASLAIAGLLSICWYLDLLDERLRKRWRT